MSRILNGRTPIEFIKYWIVLFFAATIVGSAVFFFMVPSHLAIASISGLAVVLSSLVPLHVSTITMILNLICLVLAFLFVGKEFAANTVVLTIYMPLVIGFWERVLPDYQSIMGDPFLDMVCYLFTVSIGIAILFLRNASTGGMDVIVMMLNKYLHIDMGSAMSAAGVIIAISAIFVYDIKTGVLSMLGSYLNGIVLDHYLFGMSAKKRMCILSEDHYEEIRDFIVNDLHSGASIYKPMGAFNYQERIEIQCIVHKQEYPKLMTYIEKIDPKAFVTVYNVSEIRYRPKKHLNERI